MNLCISCLKLPRCPILLKQSIRRSENLPEDCKEWEEASPSQKVFRELFCAIAGSPGSGNLVKVLCTEEGDLTKDIQEGEEMDVDLSSLITPGTNTVEREEQLRFEVGEDGEKRPRTSLTLRKHANALGIPFGMALGMSIDQIVKHIIHKEVELGLIAKVKNTKKAPVPEDEEEKEPKMAEGRRILLPRRRDTEASPAPAQESPKDSQPTEVRAVAKVGRPPKRAPIQEAAQETPSQAPQGAPPADMEALVAHLLKFLVPEIQLRVAEAVDVKITEGLNRILASVNQGLKGTTEEVIEGVAKENRLIIDGITALHDLLATNEVIQWVDPDSGAKSPLDLLLPEGETILTYIAK